MAITGLLFHVCGEAVVNVNSTRTDRQTDKENYIDFRLRLLGEPGGVPVLLSPGIHSFPLQAWLAHRVAVHLPGQAWLGSVLLQDRLEGGKRVGAQEPASLHRHEPHRPQPGARYPGATVPLRD